MVCMYNIICEINKKLMIIRRYIRLSKYNSDLRAISQFRRFGYNQAINLYYILYKLYNLTRHRSTSYKF